jgi:hypothetical protein
VVENWPDLLDILTVLKEQLFPIKQTAIAVGLLDGVNKVQCIPNDRISQDCFSIVPGGYVS